MGIRCLPTPLALLVIAEFLTMLYALQTAKITQVLRVITELLFRVFDQKQQQPVRRLISTG